MEEWRDVPGFSNYQVSNNGNLRKKMVPIVKGKYFKKCHSKYSEISEHEWMPFKKMYSPDGFLKSISKYYKVARPTIRSIINGKSWSHV